MHGKICQCSVKWFSRRRGSRDNHRRLCWNTMVSCCLWCETWQRTLLSLGLRNTKEQTWPIRSAVPWSPLPITWGQRLRESTWRGYKGGMSVLIRTHPAVNRPNEVWHLTQPCDAFTAAEWGISNLNVESENARKSYNQVLSLHRRPKIPVFSNEISYFWSQIQYEHYSYRYVCCACDPPLN